MVHFQPHLEQDMILSVGSRLKMVVHKFRLIQRWEMLIRLYMLIGNKRFIHLLLIVMEDLQWEVVV